MRMRNKGTGRQGLDDVSNLLSNDEDFDDLDLAALMSETLEKALSEVLGDNMADLLGGEAGKIIIFAHNNAFQMFLAGKRVD